MANCPRCGATLRPGDAREGLATPGYAPALVWEHRRADGGWCRLFTGPPVGWANDRAGATIAAEHTPLSAPDEVPGLVLTD